MIERFAYCHFCDDIREEVDGKHSYVGVWGPTRTSPTYPLTLHQFAFVVGLRVEADDIPSKLTVFIEDTEDRITTIDAEVGNIPDTLPKDLLSNESSRTVMLLIRMPGFVVRAPGKMTAYVGTVGQDGAEDERNVAGSVHFMIQEPAE